MLPHGAALSAHRVQPQWWKVFKVFLLLGLFTGFMYVFGWLKTLLFFTVFFSLSLLMHMVYRVKTQRWEKSWLDFVVSEVDGEQKPTSIGKFYYAAVAFNAILALLVSQLIKA